MAKEYTQEEIDNGVNHMDTAVEIVTRPDDFYGRGGDTPDIQPPVASFTDGHSQVLSGTRKRLGSADVRKIRDLKTEDVDVPQWGGFVTIKALTSAERDDFESSLRIKKNGKNDVSTANMRAKLVVMCAVDEYGHRIWSDTDAGWLGEKSSAVLSKLYDVATRLSGISEEDAKELEKNSKSDLSAD